MTQPQPDDSSPSLGVLRICPRRRGTKPGRGLWRSDELCNAVLLRPDGAQVSLRGVLA